MFCPTCHDPNPVGEETCSTCQSPLPDRQRVYIGRQFILLNANADQPIAVCLDGGTPMTVSRPTIISRHRHAVAFGDSRGGRRGRSGILVGRRPTYHFPLPDLPRLDAPRLDLTAVVTERRIYRPEDEAHIFIVAPDHPGGVVELEVRLADQSIMREPVRLNDAGTALFPYTDLEEGEYTVRVQRAGRNKTAECRFSVAEFTLSPLIAVLEAHTYTQGTLRFQLGIQQLSVPYSGPVEIGLQCTACEGRVVHTQTLQVQDGDVASDFNLSDHNGPFKLQITTPQGETALVDLPGSAASERERIVINPMGRIAEASLLPGDDTQPLRGMHIGYGKVNTAPLRLESAIAKNARFTATGDYATVQIITHNLLSGENAVHDWRDVTQGDRLTVEVNPPFTLFTVAVTTTEPSTKSTRLRLYESWAAVVRPPDLEATIATPDKAAPGDQITVTLSAFPSPRLPPTVHCLLLAYDARLEHESPLPKLGQRQYQAIRDTSSRLGDGPVPDANQFLSSMPYRRSMSLASGLLRSAPRLFRAAEASMVAAPAGQADVAPIKSTGARTITPVEEKVGAPPLLIPPTREDFPELIYLELFEFTARAERLIPLGDQIGTWRCRAYLISGLDVVELTADVQADKPLYAELDLPAIVGEGDEIEASVTYHSDGPAEMTITLPEGETIQGMVMGHGSEHFKLSAPGEVSVQLGGQAGQDWTTRTVKTPGIQSVTASRLELLQAGETITGQRVVVYPGPDLVLTDTIEALLRYPFG